MDIGIDHGALLAAMVGGILHLSFIVYLNYHCSYYYFHIFFHAIKHVYSRQILSVAFMTCICNIDISYEKIIRMLQSADKHLLPSMILINTDVIFIAWYNWISTLILAEGDMRRQFPGGGGASC